MSINEIKSKNDLLNLYAENNIKTEQQKAKFLMNKLNIWKFDSRFYNQEDKLPNNVIETLESIIIKKL